MARIKMLGLVLMAVVLLPNTAPAQPPDVLWTKTYGGEDGDEGNLVVPTIDGGYIVVGQTIGRDYDDVYFIKTDSDGDTIWTKTYGGSNPDFGYSVVQTNDNGFVIAGMTDSYGAGWDDVYLIKTDANGDTLWTKTYGGKWSDQSNSVAKTADGGFVIAGWTASYGAGGVYLIKTDANGDSVWTRIYGGSSDDKGYSVVQTRDGGYIVAGQNNSYGGGSYDVYLIRTDADGDTLWTRTYGGSDDDKGYSVAQTIDGGYIIAGITYSFGAGSDDVYLIKTDANGDTLWTKTYGGSNVDWGHSVVQTTDGGYIITGGTLSFGAGWYDVYLIKTDDNGDTLWTKTYGGSSSDWGSSVAQTGDGGYIIVGGAGSYGNNLQVYLIRLGPETDVGETSNITVECSNLRIGQNPFSTTTTISYQIPERSEVSLNVYDITGGEIKRLVDSVQERGDYHLQLDMTGYAQGVYFIRMETSEFKATRKIILFR